MEDRLSHLQEVAELPSVQVVLVAFRMHQEVAGKEVARLEEEGSRAYQREAWWVPEESGVVLLVAGLVGLVRPEQVLLMQRGAKEE